MYIRLIKADKKDWKILRRHDYDTEDGKQYFYIEGPNGIYQDADGNTYHFNTYEDALEELGFLRGEHDEDEKKIKANEDDDDDWEVMPSPYGSGYVIATPDGGYLADEDDEDEIAIFNTRRMAQHELEYYKDQYDSGIELKTV